MTDLKKKLIDMAKEVTGDNTIVAAGDFQPKGLTWKRAAAAGAGSLAGSEISGGDSTAAALGSSVGYIMGTYAGSSGSIPPVVVLAASPENLYVMTTTNAKGIILAQGLTLLDTLERENLLVEAKQKVTVRTIIIKDESTGHEYKLEGKRLLFHHMNDIIDTLAGDVE